MSLCTSTPPPGGLCTPGNTPAPCDAEVNGGAVPHDFKLCTKPTTTKADTCTGKVTKQIVPGSSATLTVAITKAGSYEYLCTVPGHATAGMKGLLKVT